MKSFSHCTKLVLTLLTPSAFKASARVYQLMQIMQAKLLRLKSESQEHQFPFTRKHTTVESSGDSNVDTFEGLLIIIYYYILYIILPVPREKPPHCLTILSSSTEKKYFWVFRTAGYRWFSICSRLNAELRLRAQVLANTYYQWCSPERVTQEVNIILVLCRKLETP